jgi:hypothetical protein
MSNMAYREYLIKNADIIIRNEQNIALGNCSNIIPTFKETMPSSPILFNSIIKNPSIHDKPSDLKDNFLNNYLNISRISTPAIQYNI